MPKRGRRMESPSFTRCLRRERGYGTRHISAHTVIEQLRRRRRRRRSRMKEKSWENYLKVIRCVCVCERVFSENVCMLAAWSVGRPVDGVEARLQEKSVNKPMLDENSHTQRRCWKCKRNTQCSSSFIGKCRLDIVSMSFVVAVYSLFSVK